MGHQLTLVSLIQVSSCNGMDPRHPEDHPGAPTKPTRESTFCRVHSCSLVDEVGGYLHIELTW